MSRFDVVSLANATGEDRYGGKAANLARLCSAGVSTAPGVVLGVKVLEEHMTRLDILDRVTSFFSAITDAEAIDLKPEAARLRRILLDSQLAPELMQAIEDALDDSASYAVRSSAPGEDGSVASFAGQFDSVLQCRSIDAIAEAVRCVWTSLFSERAVSYAVHHRCAPRGMAVIIQRQVDAAVSGVMFTRDPRNPASTELMVEYCAGLGEKLVSGKLSPGRLRIHRIEGTVREEASPSEPVTWSPALAQVGSMLRETGLRLETLFGGTQDVEWSVDKAGRLFILQARPVTGNAKRSASVVWTNANIAENFPDPVVPLLRSFVGLGYAAYFRSLGRAFGISQRRMGAMAEALDNLVGCHGGRLYYNLSNIHTVLYLAPGGPWLARFFNQFIGAREFPEPELIAQSKVAQMVELSGVAFRVAWRYLFIERGLRKFEQNVDAYAAASAPQQLSDKHPEQLAELLRGFLDIRLKRWTWAALADTAAMVCYGVLQRILRDRNDADVNDLLKGLPGLASAIPVERLWDLSQQLRKDVALVTLFLNLPSEIVHERLQVGEFPAFRDSLEDYFNSCGFRSSGELMLVRPTPAEDPLPVLRLLKSYLEVGGEGPAEISRQQANARRDATRRVRRQLGPLLGTLFPLILRATQGAIRLRERARMKQALLYTRLRHVVLALGKEMVSKGVLDEPEDVLYLEIQEAIALAEGEEIESDDVRQRVVQRRSELSACEELNPPDSLVLPRGETWQAQLNTTAEEEGQGKERLTGAGACGGHARGRAAVVLDVAEIDRIRKDQILVTRQTDPGWAAVFFMVKGLVIERGGLLSHGAIIAREYGIPAVVGVREATRLIQDGQFLYVDGDQGLVDYVRE